MRTLAEYEPQIQHIRKQQTYGVTSCIGLQWVPPDPMQQNQKRSVSCCCIRYPGDEVTDDLTNNPLHFRFTSDGSVLARV